MPPIDRYEVELMITRAIIAVENKQQERHDDFVARQLERDEKTTTQLEPIITHVKKQMGSSDLVRWTIPVGISIFMLVRDYLGKH
jgi:hypothetical protein